MNRLRHGLLVTTQDPPDGRTVARRWRELLTVAQAAESAGFASFHLPEHHGRDDGYLPQPLVACAAVAAVTSSIAVATGVTVGPLRHPLHLAEEAVVVDVLSEGRLLLAVGMGAFRPEYEMFGVPFARLGERFEEFLTVLLAAMTGERVTFSGAHYSVGPAVVRPLSVSRPRPDVWVGAMSLPGCVRAGRLGLPLYLDPLRTIAELEPLVDAYRRAAADAGFDGRVILSRWGWVDEGGDASRVWWPHVREALWSYLVEIPRLDSRSVSAKPPASAEELRLELVAPDRLLVGDAGTVGQQAVEWASRLGAERLVVKLQGATGPWGDELLGAVARYSAAMVLDGDREPWTVSSARYRRSHS